MILRDEIIKTKKNFSLIETILLDNDFENIDLHLKRLKKSAEYFDYSFSKEEILEKLNNLSTIIANERYKVRILLDSSGELHIEHTKLDNEKQRYNLTISEYRTDKSNIFLFHKTTNRELYNRELEKARANDFFEALFLNRNNEVTEGAITNIYIKKNDNIYTPPLECGLLNGTVRQMLIERNEAKEEVISLGELKNADEIYISNSIIGFRRVDDIKI